MIWSKSIYGTPTGYDQIIIGLDMVRQLPSSSTIRRSRRKIQELNPHLRGTKYSQKLRKKIADQKGTHIYREEMHVPIKQTLFDDPNIGKPKPIDNWAKRRY